jgi:lincosamide nucleotidyltransferase A/C/D/E
MDRPVYEERDPRLPLTAPDLAALADVFEAAGIEVWLDGGWGVDALLGEQTRVHDDLDLVICLGDVASLVTALDRHGYEVAKGVLPMSIVLLDGAGRQIDVHPVEFTASGDGIYQMDDGRSWAYPAAGFTGSGTVLGRTVRCLTPEVQVLCHAGYDLEEDDVRDLAALRERFGVGPSTGS